MSLIETINKIKENLTQDLLKPKYRGSDNPLKGHCYVASEALYHLGAKELGYKPMVMRVDGDTHWFLQYSDEKYDLILDITLKQFNEPPDYTQARCCGFLTKQPSKRAEILIDRVKQ